MHSINKLVGLFFAFFAISALAITLQDHMVRVEVVSIDENAKSMQAQIVESGDDVAANAGEIVTFQIPEDVHVEMDINDRLYQPYVAFNFGDLRQGDTVLLEFENGEDLDRPVLIRVEDPQDDIRTRTLEENRLIEDEEVGE